MNTFKSICTLFVNGLLILQLVACSSSENKQERAEQQTKDEWHLVNVTHQQLENEQSPGAYYANADKAYDAQRAGRLGLYRSPALARHVGHYVQNMAQDMIANMEYLNDKTPVGVTHFALLDSDLQQTNILGLQMAESFIHELHKFRIPVIDFKATDYIRVTQGGDFLLSRDFLELKAEAPIEYILTGTLGRHQGGYLVNARIIGLKSKAVVASATSLLPFYVVDALIPEDQATQDGIKLIQGE